MPADSPIARRAWIAVIGPGILIAATGVGAGDLATGAFAGSKLGVAVLWAVALGAGIKFVLTEGLARWQLVTGETLLEGAIRRLGPIARYFFITYFLVWSFSVGSSLISACGVAAHALFPVFDDPVRAKMIWGALHSLVALGLVLAGSFRLFEWTMSLCIGLMFLLVVLTAVLIGPDWPAVLQGLFVPRIPAYAPAGVDEGATWTLALMGGVGGTLTVLSYGYWIREEGRADAGAIRLCRIDLGVAYAATALFGMSMVIIASAIDLERQPSAQLVVSLGDQLGGVAGPAGRLLFLVGAWAAMFSSMLGVWQSTPYLFADYLRITRPGPGRDRVDIRSTPYRAYLVGIATIPMVGLFYNFELVQKLNAVYGALVMPMLALTLFLLNRKPGWMGVHRNRPLTTLILIGTLLFFAFIGMPELAGAIKGLFGS
ncbi:MAG: Nramp family divalent metal transporter [Rhodothermales bacterium]